MQSYELRIKNEKAILTYHLYFCCRNAAGAASQINKDHRAGARLSAHGAPDRMAQAVDQERAIGKLAALTGLQRLAVPKLAGRDLRAKDVPKAPLKPSSTLPNSAEARRPLGSTVIDMTRFCMARRSASGASTTKIAH